MGREPRAWIPQAELRQRVISKRSYIYSLIKDARLADGFERGGNRAHQPANLQLAYGPDVGGTSANEEGARYLPASQRYNGRIYARIEPEAWEAVGQSRAKYRVLIMSGLYGLIEPDEWIRIMMCILQIPTKTMGSLYHRCGPSYLQNALQRTFGTLIAIAR